MLKASLLFYMQQFVVYLWSNLGPLVTRIFLVLSDVYTTLRYIYFGKTPTFETTFYHTFGSIHKYTFFSDGASFSLKFFNDDFDCFNTDPKHCYSKQCEVLYACIMSNHGIEVLDCTDDIKQFALYFDNTNPSVTWKLVLDHIFSFQPNPNELLGHNLLICKNDNLLTELNLPLTNEFLESQFSV